MRVRIYCYTKNVSTNKLEELKMLILIVTKKNISVHETEYRKLWLLKIIENKTKWINVNERNVFDFDNLKITIVNDLKLRRSDTFLIIQKNAIISSNDENLTILLELMGEIVLDNFVYDESLYRRAMGIYTNTSLNDAL